MYTEIMAWEQSATEHNYKTERRKGKFDMHTIHFGDQNTMKYTYITLRW